jgi:hypothetical protein
MPVMNLEMKILKTDFENIPPLIYTIKILIKKREYMLRGKNIHYIR